jgi:hypothetical protein
LQCYSRHHSWQKQDADPIESNAVNKIVRQVVEGMTVNRQGQRLEIQDALLVDHIDAEYVVDFLQEHRDAVSILYLVSCEMTREAVREIVRVYFVATTLRHIRLEKMNLGKVNGWRLLSGFHGNTSVARLDLFSVGLEGAEGGL